MWDGWGSVEQAGSGLVHVISQDAERTHSVCTNTPCVCVCVHHVIATTVHVTSSEYVQPFVLYKQSLVIIIIIIIIHIISIIN